MVRLDNICTGEFCEMNLHNPYLNAFLQNKEKLMTTYLLSWNPKMWEWFDMQADIAEVATNGFFEMRWSSGVTKKIKPDDLVF